MIEEEDAPAPRVGVPQLIILLVHVSREIDRCAQPNDLLLDFALRALALRLTTGYVIAGAPYGDDEAGFRQWLHERWPAPSTA